MIGDNLGTLVMFAVALLPIYVAIIGWFAGRPRNMKLPVIALAYLFGVIVAILLLFAIWDGIFGLLVDY